MARTEHVRARGVPYLRNGLAGGTERRVLPDMRLSLADVGVLIGVPADDVEELVELWYLSEPSRENVSLEAFLALLEQSPSAPRLRGLRIAERIVWAWVFARDPKFLGAIVRFRFT